MNKQTSLRFIFERRLPGRSYRARLLVNGQQYLIATISNAVKYAK